MMHHVQFLYTVTLETFFQAVKVLNFFKNLINFSFQGNLIRGTNYN